MKQSKFIYRKWTRRKLKGAENSREEARTDHISRGSITDMLLQESHTVRWRVPSRHLCFQVTNLENRTKWAAPNPKVDNLRPFFHAAASRKNNYAPFLELCLRTCVRPIQRCQNCGNDPQVGLWQKLTEHENQLIFSECLLDQQSRWNRNTSCLLAAECSSSRSMRSRGSTRRLALV